MMIIDTLRQPEYTGENRCTPCTIVNIAIAAVVSMFAALGSVLLGGGIFALSLGAIYLRGYLVPGTPTLTKRYFPDYVLQWFDKNPTAPLDSGSVEIDPEQVLLNADAVEHCREGADLCLTPSFRETWRSRIDTVNSAHNSNKEFLASALKKSLGDDRISVEENSNLFTVRADDVVLGQWSSEAAVIADIAAATELSECSPNWTEFSAAETARVLMGLRVFIEQCPKCGGPIQVGQEVVESCCRSHDVIASSCQDCGARLFEVDWDEGIMDESQAESSNSVQAST